jgi:hypothetical protein
VTPGDATTVVGALGRPQRAVVDSGGRVTPVGAAWSVDWWIGAEDRWHLPQNEASVRQHLVGDAPVVETTMRVPGGDAAHLAYAVHGRDGADRVVIEVENRSAVPFAVALAVHQIEPTAVSFDDTSVRVGEQTALVLTKPPARRAVGAGVAVVVVPLPHTARLRATVPLEPLPPTTDPIDELPGADRVVAGWRVQLRRGLQATLPSGELERHLDPARAALLLAHGGDHLVGVDGDAGYVGCLRALDRWGFADEVAEVLAATSDRPMSAAELVALGEHWRLSRDEALVELLSGALAAGVRRLGRRRPGRTAIGERPWRIAGLHAAAAVLDGTGQRDAAASVRARAERLDPEPTPAPTGFEVLDQVRAHLVDEAGDGLALCPRWPAEWNGQGLEVHGAPTTWGRLSYGVRWHGERPALLWELDQWDETAVTLTAPGLDTGWSSREPRGEALLGPVGPPGGPTPGWSARGARESPGGPPPDEGASFS